MVSGVYAFVIRLVVLFFSCVALSSVFAGGPQNSGTKSVRYPWVYPSDINERIRDADFVLSGTILSTVPGKTRLVDGVEIEHNEAKIRIDRIFKGQPERNTLQFVWFSPAPASGGNVYAGPPLATFVYAKRYLVFLRRDDQGYRAAMPIYAIEVPLAPALPNQLPDVSQAPEQVRRSEMAKELEAAALSMPRPDPGVTGEAAIYFPYVVDLIGGCAEPFLRHFVASESNELSGAAQRWLAIIIRQRRQCTLATG